MRKVGGTQLPPRRGPTDQGFGALPSMGSKQAPQINRVRDDKGTRIRAYLEPTGSRAPHMSCSRASEGS
jgi:hypothetical protein